jgi:hypothetical protein
MPFRSLWVLHGYEQETGLPSPLATRIAGSVCRCRHEFECRMGAWACLLPTFALQQAARALRATQL